MVDVIMPDNTIKHAVDVMPELIRSAVQNALEASEGLEIRSKASIEELGWMITDYLEISTGEKVDVLDVITELRRQR